MGEIATERKDDWHEDGVQDVTNKSDGNPPAEGHELKEAERNSGEPTNDISLEGAVASEIVEAEPQREDGGEEIDQIEDEAMASSAEPTPARNGTNGPKKEAPGVESQGNQPSGVLEPNVEVAPAGAENPHEEQLGEEVPVSLAQSVDEALREERVGNGWSPQQKPELKSLVKSEEQTEEESKEGHVVEGAAGPKIEYFCAPNQNLTSDAWKIFFYHMLPFTTLPTLFMLLCLWCAYLWWGWSSLLFYTTMLTLLAFTPPIYSRWIRESVSGHFYGLLARYVPSAQYVVPEKPFPEDRPYIFACHPHGRMFYSTIIFSQLHRTWRRNILQKGDLFMTAAGPFFTVPILRNVFYLLGAIPAGKTDIIAKLRQKDHVTILVGGVKEVMLGTEDEVDRIYLKKRKGFIKIAIAENTGVAPVYFFNENQMFMHNSKSFLRFWERVNKHVRVGVPFMRGRFLILPMPFRRPLLIAVGEPLFAKEGESVDDFHDRYIKALRELFDKYVSYSPDPNHKLIIQ